MGCCIYIGCGMTVPCTIPSYCSDLVTATGSMTPKQIAAGLPGQCSSGPGGAAGFPSCTQGPGLKICKNQISAGLACQISSAIIDAEKKIKATVDKVPSLTTILIILFIMLLMTVFVYGYAKSR